MMRFKSLSIKTNKIKNNTKKVKDSIDKIVKVRYRIFKSNKGGNICLL